MAIALSLLGFAALLTLAVLLADGLRAVLRRRRAESGRRPFDLVVSERREAGGRLLALTLACPEGGRLPAFAAGQHVLLQAPAGRHGQVLQRAYSLAAWTRAPRRYELGIKREAQGAVSGWAWERLQVGTKVRLSPPKGDFVLRPGKGDIVLVGGGIGITPLRAMAQQGLAAGRRVLLFQAARSAAELLYREEFLALAATAGAFGYHPVVSRPDAGWAGETGRLDGGRIVAALPEPQSADFYLCAGAAMMDDLRAGLVAAGIAPARIHREAFGAAGEAGASGQRIVLERGGASIELVTAGEPTLLAALEAHDCAPPSECRAGSCGQCRTRLTAGEVRWLLPPALPLEAGEILPCVCAPVGDLALSARP